MKTRTRAVIPPRAKKSAQGQTLLVGEQLDSWSGLVCPGTRIDKPISERAGCRGFSETPSQP